MRRYYIVSGILLILHIIDFAVAAPALVKEKRQAGVDVAPIPEDVTTMLGKRVDELNELLLQLFGVPEDHFAKLEDFAKPESSSAAHPSSSSPPSGPADGWTNVKQPLPSIPEEPSPVSSPDHAPPSPGDDLDKLWLTLFGHSESHFFPKPEESPSPPPSAPTDGWTNVKQPLPSIPEEPSLVPSPDRAPPNPGSLSESGYELMKGGAPGLSGPAALTMSSAEADHDLMGAYALPNPGPSTESDREMMDVPPSSAVPSTNPDRQSMGEDDDSPSGKRRKTEKNWPLMLT
jgi:hypothetical protein